MSRWPPPSWTNSSPSAFLRDVVDATYDDLMRRAPLHLAAERGHESVVRFLVDRGAELNPRDNGGARPLHYAAAADREGTVRALLDAGADARARDARGEQPIHWASAKGATFAVRALS